MLKESYYPHWQATVDGKPVKTAMLAPSFVGVPVPAGTHDVVFQYHSAVGVPAAVRDRAAHARSRSLSARGLWRRYRDAAPRPKPTNDRTGRRRRANLAMFRDRCP